MEVADYKYYSGFIYVIRNGAEAERLTVNRAVTILISTQGNYFYCFALVTVTSRKLWAKMVNRVSKHNLFSSEGGMQHDVIKKIY